MRNYATRLQAYPDRGRYIALLVSLGFSIALCVIDWPGIFYSIYGYPMVDRAVYSAKILYYSLTTDYIFDYTIVGYFTAEWVWNSSLAMLNRELGLSPDQIFAVISLFVVWRFSFEIAHRIGWGYMFLLINPLVVTFAFSQLRLAVAIGMVSLVWTGRRSRLVTIATYIVCASIHTGIILFAIMHLAAHLFSTASRAHFASLCATGLLMATAIGPLREVILGAIGDRRAEMHDMSSTPLYLSFWIVMWMYLANRWREVMYSLDGRYSVIVLSVVVMNLFTGGYSTRFIAAAFPSIVIAMGSVSSVRPGILVLAFIPYALFQWYYFLRLNN